MTARAARRLGALAGPVYVLLCTGLAVLAVLGVAAPVPVVALALLLLPFAVVGVVLLVQVLSVAGDGPGPGSTVAFVVAVAVLAGSQAWLLRAILREGSSPEVGTRPSGGEPAVL